MKPQDILRAAREKRGYTQEVMAGKIGVSSRMYQRYESGMFPKFKGDPIDKIDKLLGTNLAAILYDTKGRVAADEDDSDQMLNGAQVTLQDYIDEIRQHKAFLQRIIESGLLQINANLADIANDLDAIETRQRADDTVMMKALDRLVRNPPGTLAKEADTLVDASSEVTAQNDNAVDGSKKNKQLQA